MTLGLGDIPGWITSCLAVGGVIYGGVNLRAIRNQNRTQADRMQQEAIESQAKSVWWMSPSIDYSYLPDGSRSLEYEVYNDSDRLISSVFVSHQIQQRQFVSTYVDFVRPHSSTTLTMTYAPPPADWTKQKLGSWRAIDRLATLWFFDVNNRQWAVLGIGDYPRRPFVSRRDMSESRSGVHLRRQHYDEETDKDIGSSLPHYDTVEQIVAPLVAARPYASGHGFHQRTSSDIRQDDEITETVVGILVNSSVAVETATLWNHVHMVVQRNRPDFTELDTRAD